MIPKYAGKNSYEIYDELPPGRLSNERHGCNSEDGTGGGETDEDGKASVKQLTAERKELQDEIKQAVLQAAQSAGNDVSADVKRMIVNYRAQAELESISRVQLESLSQGMTLHYASAKGLKVLFFP